MTARSAGYEEWLDAVESGDGYYLACPSGHGTVPPRDRCPRCGGELEGRPLPEQGIVIARTVVRVPTPRFSDVAPYATALASFEDATLTGLVVDGEPTTIEVGDRVQIGVGRPIAGTARCLTFTPETPA